MWHAKNFSFGEVSIFKTEKEVKSARRRRKFADERDIPRPGSVGGERERGRERRKIEFANQRWSLSERERGRILIRDSIICTCIYSGSDELRCVSVYIYSGIVDTDMYLHRYHHQLYPHPRVLLNPLRLFTICSSNALLRSLRLLRLLRY